MKTTALATAAPIVRKPMRTENVMLLGLLGLTFLAGFTSSKALHIAAGAVFTGAVSWHIYKHRKAL